MKEIILSPSFNANINQLYTFKVPKPFFIHNDFELSLIEFAALYGSISCFRFLYVNESQINRIIFRNLLNIGIIHLAIARGNNDIMTILEQEKIQPDTKCIKYAIYFHRIEILDWLLEQFNNMTDYLVTSCFKQEFVHGIQRIDRIYHVLVASLILRSFLLIIMNLISKMDYVVPAEMEISKLSS